MKSKSRVGLVILALIMTVFPVWTAQGAVESQTIYIVDTINDGYVTETGVWFYDTNFATITDPDMGIFAYVTFRDLEINRWESLTNATLRLFMAGQYAPDLDSKVTIYGVKINNFQGFSNAGEVMSSSLTSHKIIYNTSAFTGENFIEIDVTELVRELYSTITWTGDGHSGTDDKDNMGFMFLSSGGHDTRAFYQYSPSDSLGPRLKIFWGEPPPPPTPPAGDPPLPPGFPDPIYNETYRNTTIWEVDHNGPNRTGEGFAPEGITVNWNTLNLTLLTEIDSGDAILVNNASSATLSAFIAQQHNALYNDTGDPANVTSFFLRFAFQVNSVTNEAPAPGRVMSVVSISTVSPVGGNGLMDGLGGDWGGLFIQLNADSERWGFRLAERSGAAFTFGTTGPLKTEGDGNIYYVEFAFHDVGNYSYIQYREFSDPLYQKQIKRSDLNLTQASGPMRYPQVTSSLSTGTSRIAGEFWTFQNFTLSENSSWLVTDLNGTIIGEFDDYEDAIIFVDDELGTDPAEPDPAGEDWDQTGPFQRFSVRLYILLIGVGLIFGPLMYWSTTKTTGYQFVIGAFIMLIGFALMYAAGSV